MVTRRQILIGLGSLAATAAVAPIALAGAGDVIRISGRAFGTTWQVTLPPGPDAKALATGFRGILDAIDRSMSPFRADSELGRFNRSQDTSWLPVSEPFHTVAASALGIARLTDGAFDPGVGPAVHRYGFGPIDSGYTGRHTAFGIGTEGLRKADPALSLDLCGIAKGYSLDRLAAFLDAQGVASFLIEVGGEVYARGVRPDGTPWRIGIADPADRGVHSTLALTDMAMATSGDAINAYEIAGRRYSHTIDPATGEPVRNGVASVSVLAPAALQADALATALMVMGPERGLSFASANGLPVLYLMRGASGIRAEANALFNEQGQG